MPKIKVQKTKDYTVMSNYHLRDKNLSLKAKGLLSMMFSLPDEWDYSVPGLVAICKESKTAIQSVLKELESSGYLVRKKIIDRNGRFDYEYIIFEQNFNQLPKTEIPFTVNPCTENVPQLNTNKSITKELNKDIYKNNIYNIYQSNITLEDVKKQICYEKFNDRRIDEIVLLIKDILNSSDKTIKIGISDKPAEEVKEIFRMLNESHIEYVLYCLDNVHSKIKNMRAYLITCLYNAPFTMENWYESKVNYDLGGR